MNSPPPPLLGMGHPATEPESAPIPHLPTEVWATIFSHVSAPLSQDLGSPDAVIAARAGTFSTARKNLISLAHVNRAAHAAALPILFGTLSVALRPQATHDGYQMPQDPAQDASPGWHDRRESNSPYAGHDRHMKLRERLAVVSRIFPGWCRKGGKCSEAHRERDERIAQVTEVPEVFPFVVVYGTLHLASLTALEKARRDGDDESIMLGAIQQSVASLLQVGGVGMHDNSSKRPLI